MKYTIAYNEDIEELIAVVNHYLENNWKLQGSVYIYDRCYYQALYKEG